jgi:hypothetical protein
MNEPAKPIKIVTIHPPGSLRGHEELGNSPNNEANENGGNDSHSSELFESWALFGRPKMARVAKSTTALTKPNFIGFFCVSFKPFAHVLECKSELSFSF